jgi:hypothetical protein
LQWLLRFRSANSQRLISDNRAANARFAARLKLDGAAVRRPRKVGEIPVAFTDRGNFNGAVHPSNWGQKFKRLIRVTSA